MLIMDWIKCDHRWINNKLIKLANRFIADFMGLNIVKIFKNYTINTIHKQIWMVNKISNKITY